MKRALQLAEFGRGSVSPNPMVGCVIVHNEIVIGEGWHRHYGGPHAEVRAIEDVERRGHGDLLSEATAYVTLEPCSHFGKTPPCAELLVKKQLKKVVICNEDPNPLVAGKGIQMLKNAGIEVEIGLLREEGWELNKRFFLFMTQKRPYVILKWAESADGFLGRHNVSTAISGRYSNRRVHQWRSEEDAILVGSRTITIDNPQLSVRNWVGYNPVRIVLDRNGSLSDHYKVFDKSQPTIIVNYQEGNPIPSSPGRYHSSDSIGYVKIEKGLAEIEQLLNSLAARRIQSVLVEGGAQVLHSFLDSGLWDEIRRCQSPKILGDGVSAPSPKGVLMHSEYLQDDLWTYYENA